MREDTKEVGAREDEVLPGMHGESTLAHPSLESQTKKNRASFGLLKLNKLQAYYEDVMRERHSCSVEEVMEPIITQDTFMLTHSGS